MIDIENLSVEIKTETEKINAIRNLSLSLRQGEILAIVGESGSGKTMVCRSIMELLPKSAKVTSGVIKAPKNEMAMVFQNPMTSLDPTMTIGKQLSYAIKSRNKIKDKTEIKNRAIELLKLVQIDRAEERYNQYPWQLSGGMRQRCVLAMALGLEPKVLLADEPTTALDVTVQASILGLISSLREKLGLSILFITHDLGVVAGIADRVAIMKAGSVVECDTTENVYHSPKHEYTKELMNSLPSNAGEFEVKSVENVETVLQVKDLSHYFKLGRKSYIRAANNVSFDIKHGEIFSIVGESGSGKSTLARCILNMYKPNSGEIIYDENVVLASDKVKMSREDKRKVSAEIRVISQDSDTALNPHMTVRQVIEEPLLLHHMFKTKAEMYAYMEELLDDVELPRTLMDQPVTMLSGGQRQRVSIARAFGSKPKLLIADEPLASLDVTMQMQIVKLFAHLIKEHDTSMLFIAHDLSMVRFLSTRVGVMYKGELVEVGTTEEIFNNPKHEYTKKLIAAMPIPDPDIEREKIRLFKERV
ncbi:MAG: ABC transporter ATP-binding protein [Lachnospiraceae bacterium]|nr:ABC transporter ATP-binding protein [Lachnospiraceae bacterium]